MRKAVISIRAPTQFAPCVPCGPPELVFIPVWNDFLNQGTPPYVHEDARMNGAKKSHGVAEKEEEEKKRAPAAQFPRGCSV